MQNIALAHSSTDIVEYAPACTLVTGKTISDRRLSVLPTASFEAKMFASSRTGKVGKAARLGLADAAIERIAKKAREGNYRPLAETLALVLGESVTISNRASFDALPDWYSSRIADLALAKNGGYTINKKTNVPVPNAKRKMLTEVMEFIKIVQKKAASL